jgi:uncharacterized protein YdbL (DUF1318 family)
MKHSRRFFLTTLILLLCGTATGLAQGRADADAAAARMRERLPAVDMLKENGQAGENNLGLLEARGELAPADTAMLEAENADRLTIYRHIAAGSRQSVEVVGRQRAVRIAELSKPGVWLQNAQGAWYQKR